MNKKFSFALIFLVVAATCLWCGCANAEISVGRVKLESPGNPYDGPHGNWWMPNVHTTETYQRVSIEFNTGSLAGQPSPYSGGFRLALNQDVANSGYWLASSGYVLNIRGIKDMWLSRNDIDGNWVWGGAGTAVYDTFDSDLLANTTYKATLEKNGSVFTATVVTLAGVIVGQATYTETIDALTGGQAGMSAVWGPDYTLDNFEYQLQDSVYSDNFDPYGDGVTLGTGGSGTEGKWTRRGEKNVFKVIIPEPVPLSIYQGIATIDGNLADWADAQWISNELVYGYYTGTNYGSQDVNTAGTKFAFKWSPNITPDVPGYLYVAVIVEDSSHQLRDTFTAWYASDRVEFFVHGNPADWASLNTTYYGYQDIAQQYIVGITDSDHSQSWMMLGNNYGTPDELGLDANSAVKVVGNQLIYEVKIPVYDNWGYAAFTDDVITEMKAGIKLGFDLTVDTRNIAFAGGNWEVEQELIAMLDRTTVPAATRNKAMGQATNMLTVLLEGPICYSQYDLDGDCFVDFNDLDVLVSEWLVDGLVYSGGTYTDNFDIYASGVDLANGPLTDQNWSRRADKNAFQVSNPTTTAGTIVYEAPNWSDGTHGNWWKPNIQTTETYQSVSIEFNTGDLTGQPSVYSGGLRLVLNQDVANSGFYIYDNTYSLQIRGLKDMWLGRIESNSQVWGGADVGQSYYDDFAPELQANTTYKATFTKDGSNFTGTVETLAGVIVGQATYTESIAARTGGQAGMSGVWGSNFSMDNFSYKLGGNDCTLQYDLNGDCEVNLNDFSKLASEWMQSGF